MRFLDLDLFKSLRIRPPTVEDPQKPYQKFASAYLITNPHVPKDTVYMTTGNCVRGRDGLWRDRTGQVVDEPRHVCGDFGFNDAAKAVNIAKESDSGRAEEEDEG